MNINTLIREIGVELSEVRIQNKAGKMNIVRACLKRIRDLIDSYLL